MLGALALKWQWRKRREAAGKSTDRPNLVFGGDVHVVWEKFCRYFDVEPRIVPLQEHKFTIGPEDVEPHVDENTIGVAAVLGTTFTGHADDIPGINELPGRSEERQGPRRASARRRRERRLRVAVPLPESEWDFRLEQVRSINASGHKFGLVYPGRRLARVPRDQRPARRARLLRELPRQDRCHLHAQLLDRLRDGARPVLQLHPLRARRLPVHHGDDAAERAVPGRADRGDAASSS